MTIRVYDFGTVRLRQGFGGQARNLLKGGDAAALKIQVSD
jgi:hypothetical protein